MRIVLVLVLLLGGAALAAPARADDGAPLSVDAARDSVVASGLPPGRAAIRVTRPDALTGAPVVIGQFTGFGPGSLAVNTGSGPCWQQGALSLPFGLTPDIRPGDTVSVAGGASVTVPPGAEAGEGARGPVDGCAQQSGYAYDGVTSSGADTSGNITFAGIAQPLTQGVSVSMTDGRSTSAPVDASLAGDGTWSARVPAAELAALADGDITVNAVFAVPDVATGALAHVLGAPLTIGKRTGTPVSVAPLAAPPLPTAVSSLVSQASRRGIQASFLVPVGARSVRLRLARGGRTAFEQVFPVAAPPGARQGVRVRARLPRGRYRLMVGAWSRRTRVGPAASAVVVVR
jgi:hypothetical protein